MIINKVIQGGTALLDLTEDTVNETNLLRNETAHNSEGEPIVGQMSEGGGTGNYNDLTNKPQINGTTLSGNKTGAQLGLVSTSEKGSNNGVASLDSTGRVPSTQLPSYVDDVVEYNSASDFPVTGESGKIYIAKDTNRQYRWSGSAYVEISESLALGETAQTAYRGDRGKTAYDHSQIVNGSNPHNTTADNVILASAMTIGGQTITEVESALNALKDQGGGGGTSNYNDLSNKPQINGNSLSGNKTGSQLGLQNIILSSALTIGGQTVTEVEPALRALNEKGGGHTILDSDGVTMPQRAKLKFVGCTVTDDSTNDTTIVEAEGGGSSVVASLSITTNNTAFYGQTVTVKDSNGDTVNTGVFSNSGTVSIGVVGANYYTAIVTTYGATVSQQVAVTESGSYNVALNSDTILGAWINKGGLDYTDYADFSEVEADEEAVRRLMTIHASVDYLAECQSASDTLASSIINSDICAKWINLRDYALDTLYANTYIASMMDTADKYFYGEWVITDNTTTPPTWGAKGNVPVMTANDAPYGEASAYQVFDGNSGTSTSGTDFSYKFTNPVCVKKFESNISGGTLQGSNDGSTYTDISTPSSNSAFYLYYRVHFASSQTVHTIQFYGRELRESVPTMTSNTAPYGVASASRVYTSDWEPWNAFTDSSTYGWVPVIGVDCEGDWIKYNFVTPMAIKMISLIADYNPVRLKNFELFGINNGVETSLGTFDNTDSTEITYKGWPMGIKSWVVNNTTPYEAYKLVIGDVNPETYNPRVYRLQFYGLNYSEYDWDAEHPRHYLYDHGVELEQIETGVYISTSGYTAVNGIKNPSDLEMHTTADYQDCNFGITNSINNTNGDYSLLFMNICEVRKGGIIAYVSRQKQYYSSDLISTGYFLQKYSNTRRVLDISQVRESFYMCIGAPNDRWTNVDEWWLE